jgi:hypothetical protein
MMRSTIFLMALSVGAGCAGGEADAVSAASSAYVGHAEPLLRVDHRLWNNAPAGCEGRLGASDLRWGVASGAPELVVALIEGTPICVDTYSAIESELAAIDSPALDGLWAGYVTTLQELEPNVTFQGNAAPEVAHREVYEAEPHPQPSLEVDPIGVPGLDLGLDHRLDAVSAEPHPQPSAPTEGSSSASGTSSGSSTSTSSTSTSTTPSEGTAPSMGTPPRGDDPRRP